LGELSLHILLIKPLVNPFRLLPPFTTGKLSQPYNS